MEAPAVVGCLVVEEFEPIRARLVQALVAKGLKVSGAVNHVDAVAQMGREGVPLSFIVSASAGGGMGLALARGLGKLEKTNSRPVLLMFDDPRALEQVMRQPLHPSVLPVVRYASMKALVAAILEQLAPMTFDPAEGQDVTPKDATAADGSALDPNLAGATGVTKAQVDALGMAFRTFDQIATMVKQNKLPGPMVPDLLGKVMQLFSSPDVEFKSVGAFVRQHQTLAARLLAVSNTAAYARGDRVTSVEVALSRLGLREAGAQLRTIAARAFVVGKDPVIRKKILAKLEAAYVVAVVGTSLGKRLGPAVDLEEVYTLGLFHNIGPTFLLYTVALLTDKGAVKTVDYEALDTMISNRAGELNALVCERLTLPPLVASLYSQAGKDPDPLIGVMHQAMWVADRLLRKKDPDSLEVDMEAELLGLTVETVDALKLEAPKWLELLKVYAQ